MSWCPQFWHPVAKNRIRSSFQTTCPQAELGHLFRWPVPIRWADPQQRHLVSQEEYYIRSCWHSHMFRWGVPSAELGHLFRWPVPIRWADPPVEASGGQEEYCVRSSWHSQIFIWGVPQMSWPPLLQSTIDLWNTTTPHKFWPPPPPIDHRSMEYHYTK